MQGEHTAMTPDMVSDEPFYSFPLSVRADVAVLWTRLDDKKGGEGEGRW